MHYALNATGGQIRTFSSQVETDGAQQLGYANTHAIEFQTVGAAEAKAQELKSL